MYNFLIAALVFICIGLIFSILIQSGRGGGLVDSFSSAETIFGTKTNKYLVRFSAVLAVLFFSLTVIIAFLSKQRSRSLMEIHKDSLIPEEKEQKEQEDITEGKIKIDKTQGEGASQEPLSGATLQSQESKTDESKKEDTGVPILPSR